MTGSVPAPPEDLRRNRDFRVWIAGQGFSAIGDAVSITALPLLVILLTGSGVQMGVVGVLQTLPDLLFGLPAGALADRSDRRRLMIAADLGRAALTALIPAAFLLGLPTMAVILIVTAPINVLRVLFLAAYTGAVPQIVGRSQFARANGYAEAVYSAGFVLGPAVAGVLVATVGPAITLALDAASFLVSAAAIMLIRRPLNAAPAADRARNLAAEIAEGVRYIRTHRMLRTLVAFAATISVVRAPLVPAVIYYLTVDRGTGAETVGIVVGVFGLGFVLGSVGASQMARGRTGMLILAATAAEALVVAAFAYAVALPLVVACTFVAGVCEALFIVSYITLRALATPDQLLSRIGSSARTLTLGLQPIGFFVGGLLLDAVRGGGTLLTIAAVSLAATVAFGLSAPLRGARATVLERATA